MSTARNRYKTVYFNVGGVEMDGMLIDCKNGWFTIKTFFRGTVYKRRVGQVWDNQRIRYP